jgi:hypothetical protein
MSPIHALTLAALLAGARCEKEIRRELEDWGARLDSIYPLAGDTAGARAALLPTPSIGVWVRLTVDPGGEVLVERVTAGLVEGRRFGPGCEAVTVGREERSIVEDAWTDAALAERLLRRDTGVILLWSPHMPLSVDAYEILHALTREMGIDFVAILDPASDPSYAREVARERGMPLSALRPLGGVELAFRGLTTHAPSIQLFSEGRLVGSMVPGYRDREGFRLTIERVLGARPRA